MCHNVKIFMREILSSAKPIEKDRRNVSKLPVLELVVIEYAIMEKPNLLQKI